MLTGLVNYYYTPLTVLRKTPLIKKQEADPKSYLPQLILILFILSAVFEGYGASYCEASP